MVRKQNEENGMMWGFVVCTRNLILLGMERIGTYRHRGETENSYRILVKKSQEGKHSTN